MLVDFRRWSKTALPDGSSHRATLPPWPMRSNALHAIRRLYWRWANGPEGEPAISRFRKPLPGWKPSTGSCWITEPPPAAALRFAVSNDQSIAWSAFPARRSAKGGCEDYPNPRDRAIGPG